MLASVLQQSNSEIDNMYIFFLKKVFLAMLGLCCCMLSFSSCGEQGLLFLVMCGLIFGGFSCCRAWALGWLGSVVVVCGLVAPAC